MSWLEHFDWRSGNFSQGVLVFLGSYLLGCVATGYYFVRFSNGQDIRQLGSGSVGAKNVGRVAGSFGFVVTLLGDFAKGAAAVLAATYFTSDERLAALALLGVVIGHIWPMQLRFHGGKGVCTSLGGLLIFDYSLALAFAVTVVSLFILSRRLVLSGLVAYACLPAISIFKEQPRANIATLTALAFLVLIAHRKNIAQEIGEITDQRSIDANASQSPK